MNRKELVKNVVNILRDNNIRKPISVQKHTFHVSDDNGNHKDFIIKKNGTNIMFTSNDVDNIIDACIDVIKDALKHGDSIHVKGLGTLGLNYRKARATKHPATGEAIKVDARYVPKFIPGRDLKICAKVYELSIDENTNTMPPEEHAEDLEV